MTRKESLDNTPGCLDNQDMTNERLYRVLGTTDDAAGCDCCGRTNLKVYVAMSVHETGEVVYMGTTCAAKAERIPVKTIKDEIKAADTAGREAEAVARRARQANEEAAFIAWVADRFGVTINQPADLWNHSAATGNRSPFEVRKMWASEFEVAA